MKTLKYYIMTFIMALAFTLSACSTMNNIDTNNTNTRLLIQYSVLKASEESDAINRESILSVTERIKATLDDSERSVTLAYISIDIKEHINYDSLMPSDRLLVDALMGNIESVIQARIEMPNGVIDSEARENVLNIINIIEQAAYMAQ